MKFMSKKILTGTVAAGVILGGGLFGALHYNQAYAANTDQAVVQGADGKAIAKEFRGGKHGGFEGRAFSGSDPIQGIATLLDMDAKSVLDELKQGKTLAQLAQEKKGWSEDELLAKLVETATKSIDDAVSAGKMQQSQADQIKSHLSESLKKFIVQGMPMKPGGFKGEHGGWGRGGHGGPGGGFMGPGAGLDGAAQLLGVTKEELMEGLKSGKSLAEMAEAKGVSEEQLINKLKDNMTDMLKQFVESKGMPRGFAPQAPATGADGAAASPSN